MRLQLLGPLRAWRGSEEIVLGPPKQRAVLGLLASRVNEVVRVEEIVDAVWSSDIPRTAVNGVHTYVAGLRRALEPARGGRESGGVLVSADGGYSLRLSPDALDMHQFTQKHTQAREVRALGDVRGALGLLDGALRLWHGEAFASVPGPFAAMERMRLQELRLVAGEEWASDMLALSRHNEVVTVLPNMVAVEPLREKLRWLLMLTLYRCGRTAHALEVYRDTRRLLRDELGIEPGSELRALHEQILSGAPELGGGDTSETFASTAVRMPRTQHHSTIRPAQLPPLARGFTGRSLEMGQLRRLVRDGLDSPQGRTTAAVIAGAPGVGKSALALQVAHDLSVSFPDGQLFVDLCGTSGHRAPLTSVEALGLLLRSLGIEEAGMPDDLAGRTALYRSLLHGRKVMLVLDDAFDAEQLRPLIPQEPACVLITSRWRQSGLVARDGVYRVELPALPPEESVNLLGQLGDVERVEAEHEAALHLARLCGHLPLALRIAAEAIVTRPEMSIEVLAEAVEARRLDKFEVVRDAAANLRASFSRSYRALPPEVARMFRILGLSDSRVVTVEVAATLAGSNRGRAHRQIEALAEAYLLEELDSGRYRLNDLIWMYATECAEEEPAPSRAAALARALAMHGDPNGQGPVSVGSRAGGGAPAAWFPRRVPYRADV